MRTLPSASKCCCPPCLHPGNRTLRRRGAMRSYHCCFVRRHRKGSPSLNATAVSRVGALDYLPSFNGIDGVAKTDPLQIRFGHQDGQASPLQLTNGTGKLLAKGWG